MSKILVLVPLLLPLAACGEQDLNRLLNGSAAVATNKERISYVPGGEATPEEVTRSRYYAPGQSTGAMRDIFGSPDSFDADYDYYYKPDGTMLAVQYNSKGQWTGNLYSGPRPEVPPSSYPGAQ